MKIICGNSNNTLSENILEYVSLHKSNIKTETMIDKFNDGECRVEIQENLRGEDVFVIQSVCPPVNDNLMELMVILDAVKRSSAKRITAVIPYLGYSRQDRKIANRVPITAKLVANLLTVAGANRILTVDLHAGQIEGFFDVPVDLLSAKPLFLDDIRHKFGDKPDELIFISPDSGGTNRTRHYAKSMNVDIGIIDKRRPDAGKSEVMNVIGDVTDKICIIVDDILDSGGTLINAANALIENGAIEINAYITHGILSGNAYENLQNSIIKKIILSNTIGINTINGKIRTRNIGPLIGQAILNINNELSISELSSEESWATIIGNYQFSK